MKERNNPCTYLDNSRNYLLLLYIGVTSSILIGYKDPANSCLLCFSYVIPTDNRFYICRIDVIPTDNSFMHAEVTSPNTLTRQFDQFCHGGAQLRNMHNKTIIEFGFRMLAIIIKASVCVIRLSLSASADNTNFGLDNYR